MDVLIGGLAYEVLERFPGKGAVIKVRSRYGSSMHITEELIDDYKAMGIWPKETADGGDDKNKQGPQAGD